MLSGRTGECESAGVPDGAALWDGCGVTTDTLINTVRGPVPADELGRTLVHEHVFILSPEIQQNYPEEWGDEDERVADAVERLSALKEAGIDTIIDPTAIGLGRYLPRIQRVAAEIELNIVAATGHYTFNELPHYYTNRPKTDDELDVLAAHMIRDLTDGIGDTGVRAGVIKCATDKPGVTPDVERVLRAAAVAHRATGAPITTHTHARKERGLEQQAIFAEEGVDLSRVLIGHSGDTDDLDYLTRLADAGSFLGMDRFGIDGYLTTERRIEVIVELCERGYARQLTLSHDASCYLDWIAGEEAFREQLPNWHYLHISQDVLPALRQAGVSDADLDRMLVDNPRRFLASVGAGPY